MRTMMLFPAVAAAVSLATPAFATPPVPEEVARVVGYYYDGAAEGPVLVKSTACLKIDETKDSPTRNDCLEPVAGPVKKGTLVSAWTYWFVPVKATYEDVTVQVLHEGTVRETKDLKLTESLRYRTWRSSTLSKTGKWEFKILRGTTELASMKVDVQ